LKSDTRKQQEQQEQFIQEVRTGIAKQQPKSVSYTTNPESTWTDPNTGKVYEEVVPSN